MNQFLFYIILMNTKNSNKMKRFEPHYDKLKDEKDWIASYK